MGAEVRLGGLGLAGKIHQGEEDRGVVGRNKRSIESGGDEVGERDDGVERQAGRQRMREVRNIILILIMCGCGCVCVSGGREKEPEAFG